MKRLIIFSSALCVSMLGFAQSWHKGDISWPDSKEFAANVLKWKSDPRHALSADDNFFISRVKPRLRFVNPATQVRRDLVWGVNDKRLMAWLPINVNHDGNRNALPTGEFDSECFTMWSYVDHWGNWSAPLGRIPGNFTDVAHKNGVTVSSLAPVPWGSISDEWNEALTAVSALDAADVADMLVYYGHDGLGYNSEFEIFKSMRALQGMHQGLHAGLNERYGRVVPGYDLAENVWYDGTNTRGKIQFDHGLDAHNMANYGMKGEECTSLFFNYNWHLNNVLERSVANADSLCGRSPLRLYAGINMQGGQPCGAPSEIWGALRDHNISIGLWGAHDQNMFWQSRHEAGSSPEARQARYQHRLENWFSGGAHNPAVRLSPSGTTFCVGDDTEFMGMADMMSARSALSWNLDDEPFYTYFNVGNGLFFNYLGERRNDCEWYNIGIQDYMPTWRWWWADRLMGRDADAGISSSLKASFTWRDAWIGGSCLEISGSAASRYLHLFKTSYPLKGGDMVTVRYRLVRGGGDVSLVASCVGAEEMEAARFPVITKDVPAMDEWQECCFRIEEGTPLDGGTLAMLALDFEGVDDMQLRIGEISLKRADAPAPTAPAMVSAQLLRNTYKGVDAKIIFTVPNTIEGSGQVCYNSDVNVSMFALYVQEEGKTPVMYGLTTSWAAMMYGAPFSGDSEGRGRVRFGVSSLSLDMDTESDISWSAYIDTPEQREYSDDITVSRSVITPGESFTLAAIDKKRCFDWQLFPHGSREKAVAESAAPCNSWEVEGLDSCGSYDLVLRRVGVSGDTVSIVRTAYISVTPERCGRTPRIEDVWMDTVSNDLEVTMPATVRYRSRMSDGEVSRGLAIDEKCFGVKVGDVLDIASQSFSIAGWLKVNEYNGDVNWLDIVDRSGPWAINNWGWLWSSLRPDGSMQQCDQSFTGVNTPNQNISYTFGEGESLFPRGCWSHFALVFDRVDGRQRTALYINGAPVDVKWRVTDATTDSIVQEGSGRDFADLSVDVPMNDMIILGGTRHKGRQHGGNSFAGVLDDFQVWNRAMTEEDVRMSMDGLKRDDLPDGVAAYWDFENDADAAHLFTAQGARGGVKGGYFRILSDPSAEGRGRVQYEAPRFTAGAPTLQAHGYRVATHATWSGGGVEILRQSDTSGAGDAEITFPLPGVHTLTLTLTNDYGTDTREYDVVVLPAAGMTPVESEKTVEVTRQRDQVLINAVEGGCYTLSLYNLEGDCYTSKTVACAPRDLMRLHLSADTSVLVVSREGMPVCSVKMMRH